jgi:hypothetical protein
MKRAILSFQLHYLIRISLECISVTSMSYKPITSSNNPGGEHDRRNGGSGRRTFGTDNNDDDNSKIYSINSETENSNSSRGSSSGIHSSSSPTLLMRRRSDYKLIKSNNTSSSSSNSNVTHNATSNKSNASTIVGNRNQSTNNNYETVVIVDQDDNNVEEDDNDNEAVIRQGSSGGGSSDDNDDENDNNSGDGIFFQPLEISHSQHSSSSDYHHSYNTGKVGDFSNKLVLLYDWKDPWLPSILCTLILSIPVLVGNILMFHQLLGRIWTVTPFSIHLLITIISARILASAFYNDVSSSVTMSNNSNRYTNRKLLWSRIFISMSSL